MADFTVERWRVVVVALATVATMPLFVLEDPGSIGALTGVADAAGAPSAAVVGSVEKVGIVEVAEPVATAPAALTTVPTVDVAVLSRRAAAWHVARSNAPTIARLAEAARLHEAEALALAREVAETEYEDRASLDALLEAKKDDSKRQALRERLRSAEDERRATVLATPGTTTTIPWDTAPADGGPSREQWEALRYCEATGDYTAVSSTGRYRGAYQFSVTTWDWIASLYFEHLVGIDPADAAPGDQDAMAHSLYHLRGRGQWPVCGRYLP